MDLLGPRIRKRTTVSAGFAERLQQQASKSGSGGTAELPKAPSRVVACGRHEERELGPIPCILGASLRGAFPPSALLRASSRKQPELRFFLRVPEQPAEKGFSESVRGISILKGIAELARINDKELELTVVAEEEESKLEKIVMVIFDRYLSKRDLWHMHLSMMKSAGPVIYAGFNQNLRAHIPRSSIESLSAGRGKGPVLCGRVMQDTEVIFRSSSANMIILIQVSAEMMSFSLAGKPYWEVLLECFSLLVEKSLKVGSSEGDGHYVRIVLFARTRGTQMDGVGVAEDDAVHGSQRAVGSKGAGQGRQIASQGSNGVTAGGHEGAQDIYEIIWEGSAKAMPQTPLLARRLRHVFMHLHATRQGSCASPPPASSRGWRGISAADLVEASDGNVLECLNIVVDHLDQHFLDRSLRITGQSIVLLTAGNGLIRATSKKLYELTHRRFTSSAPSSSKACHMICMRQPPLHRVPWVQWPESGHQRSLVNLPTSPSWIELRYHPEAEVCKCVPSAEWLCSSLLPLEDLLRQERPLFIPTLCRSAPRPKMKVTMEEAPRSSTWKSTGPDLWEELRAPMLRTYYGRTEADSRGRYSSEYQQSYTISPSRFAGNSTEQVEIVNTMNDFIGCRLEARTSELCYQALDTKRGLHYGPWAQWEASDPQPVEMQSCIVTAANGQIEWKMEPSEHALTVFYRDNSNDDASHVNLVCKYDCCIHRYMRERADSADLHASEEDEQDDESWSAMRVKRIFHLPMRPEWNTTDSIIAGNLEMPAALPYPVDTESSTLSDKCPGWQLRSAIKQHLYYLVPRDEALQSHSEHLAAALELSNWQVGTGMDVFRVLQESQKEVVNGPGCPDLRKRAIGGFRSLVKGLEELCFSQAKGKPRSLEISVPEDGTTFQVKRKRCTVYISESTIGFPESRDWFELFYDSNFSPPKLFIFVMQWMVCTSVHLVRFLTKLARIAEESGFALCRAPIGQLFPQPAPHWVWSDERETNFDRLAFHAPKKVRVPDGLTEDVRGKLNAALLICWLQPPLDFLFLFSAAQTDYKVEPMHEKVMTQQVLNSQGEGGPETEEAQNRQLFQRLKGWVLCDKDGWCLVTVREEYINWYINRMVFADTRDARAHEQRSRLLDHKWWQFRTTTQRVLADFVPCRGLSDVVGPDGVDSSSPKV